MTDIEREISDWMVEMGARMECPSLADLLGMWMLYAGDEANSEAKSHGHLHLSFSNAFIHNAMPNQIIGIPKISKTGAKLRSLTYPATLHIRDCLIYFEHDADLPLSPDEFGNIYRYRE